MSLSSMPHPMAHRQRTNYPQVEIHQPKPNYMLTLYASLV